MANVIVTRKARNVTVEVKLSETCNIRFQTTCKTQSIGGSPEFFSNEALRKEFFALWSSNFGWINYEISNYVALQNDCLRLFVNIKTLDDLRAVLTAGRKAKSDHLAVTATKIEIPAVARMVDQVMAGGYANTAAQVNRFINIEGCALAKVGTKFQFSYKGETVSVGYKSIKDATLAQWVKLGREFAETVNAR